MVLVRKEPRDTCLQLLSTLNKKGKALKWELIKILGSEEAFSRWFDRNLILDKMVEPIEEKVGKRTLKYYRKTRKGERLFGTLMDENIVKVLGRIIGRKRLHI